MLSRERLRRELEREWGLIESAEKRLIDEKQKVVAEWMAVEDAQREYDVKRDEFEKAVSKRFNFLPHDTVVVFNVGGQMFKSTVKVWTRDRFSILAQLCTNAPKLKADTDGSFFFDRDFCVFRHILAFLRDGKLPETVEDLRDLYCEASFYRLGLLRHAIEGRMIGEDAAATKLLACRPLEAKTASTTETRPAKSAEQLKTASPKAKKAESPLPNNYSELPDPFGFT